MAGTTYYTKVAPIEFVDWPFSRCEDVSIKAGRNKRGRSTAILLRKPLLAPDRKEDRVELP